MEIRYLSHGKHETGGYRHGLFFAQQLHNKFEESTITVLRNKQTFRKLNHLKLQYWGFTNSSAALQVVPVRLAFISIFRNLFTKGRVFIIMHNYDETDGKGWLLRFYYHLLFIFLKMNSSGRFRVITDSPFFMDQFGKGIKLPIVLFPNFFDTQKLLVFRKERKDRKIHLGQWSEKNSPYIFVLAEQLSALSFECYFSTLNKNAQSTTKTYQISYFDTYDCYLEEMSKCAFSLALPSVNEGWNRVAHESILVGTTVIGFDKGGLGYLLREASMIIVKNIEEAYQKVLEGNHPKPSIAFIEKYDISNAAAFLENQID